MSENQASIEETLEDYQKSIEAAWEGCKIHRQELIAAEEDMMRMGYKVVKSTLSLENDFKAGDEERKNKAYDAWQDVLKKNMDCSERVDSLAKLVKEKINSFNNMPEKLWIEKWINDKADEYEGK